jgi:hypothetical protein
MGNDIVEYGQKWRGLVSSWLFSLINYETVDKSLNYSMKAENTIRLSLQYFCKNKVRVNYFWKWRSCRNTRIMIAAWLYDIFYESL